MRSPKTIPDMNTLEEVVDTISERPDIPGNFK